LILYILHCAEGHVFQSWFRDIAACDAQIEQKLVACPHCHSTRVSKAVMAPRVLRSARAHEGSSGEEPGSRPEVAFLDEQHATLRAMIRELREKIEAATVDVGEKFPEEARRIQYGEAEYRSIRGRASLEDAKALIEEGIEILPIPGPSSEGN
jgi:hypothetical protein